MVPHARVEFAWPFVLKAGKYAPFMPSATSKIILCGADVGSVSVVDLTSYTSGSQPGVREPQWFTGRFPGILGW